MRESTVDWQEPTDLTRGQPFTVERVRLVSNGVAIEGQFEPPQLEELVDHLGDLTVDLDDPGTTMRGLCE